jgi:hypothetical protein
MSSPEGYHPHRAAAHAEANERTLLSVRLEQVITYLAATQAVKLEQTGASFAVDVPNRPLCWLIGKIDSDRIGVTRCQVDAEQGLAADIDMIFQVTPKGWEPVEIINTENAWEEFAQEMAAQNRTIFDTQGDFTFPTFTDFWAEQIEHEK